MKQETNNEMDLLLRRLGRRDKTTVSNAADDHLDADELSAYTENVLPAAARARYTAHLTECSRCRDLIVQLSSSIGVIAASDMAKVAEPSVWRKFLASLFTPMVLRYAAPALGLIVVAAIGFMIVRRDQSDQHVTQVTNTETQPSSPAVEKPGAALNDSPTKTEPSPDTRVEKQSRGLQADSSPPQNAAPAVKSVDDDASKDAAAQPKPEQQPASANEPPPPKPSAAPTAAESPHTADTEVSKSEVKELRVAGRSAERALQAERRQDKSDFARKAKPADQVSAPATGSVANLQRDGVDLSANTRTVAGRHFRKRGGVWIDTAYDSSKDSVTLTRGSEQYRALVADEPAIKNIADTLEGEIIVVWKDHTYRIR